MPDAITRDRDTGVIARRRKQYRERAAKAIAADVLPGGSTRAFLQWERSRLVHLAVTAPCFRLAWRARCLDLREILRDGLEKNLEAFLRGSDAANSRDAEARVEVSAYF